MVPTTPLHCSYQGHPPPCSPKQKLLDSLWDQDSPHFSAALDTPPSLVSLFLCSSSAQGSGLRHSVTQPWLQGITWEPLKDAHAWAHTQGLGLQSSHFFNSPGDCRVQPGFRTTALSEPILSPCLPDMAYLQCRPLLNPMSSGFKCAAVQDSGCLRFISKCHVKAGWGKGAACSAVPGCLWPQRAKPERMLQPRGEADFGSTYGHSL